MYREKLQLPCNLKAVLIRQIKLVFCFSQLISEARASGLHSEGGPSERVVNQTVYHMYFRFGWYQEFSLTFFHLTTPQVLLLSTPGYHPISTHCLTGVTLEGYWTCTGGVME